MAHNSSFGLSKCLPTRDGTESTTDTFIPPSHDSILAPFCANGQPTNVDHEQLSSDCAGTVKLVLKVTKKLKNFYQKPCLHENDILDLPFCKSAKTSGSNMT